MLYSAIFNEQLLSLFAFYCTNDYNNFFRLFHVNFGFNSYLMDWMHDTLNKADREYGEDIFGGHGRAIQKTK